VNETVSLEVLAMKPEDLPDVDRIQTRAYDKAFVEDLAVFADRLRRYPEGCAMCVADREAVGYLFSHPGRLASPPALNRRLANDDGATNDDCYFIHDIAVLPSHRGIGVARRLIEHALRVALKRGLTLVTLVSVQGSRGYWERRGFQPVVGPEETLNHVRESYGDAACYMVQRIV
jgi:GNAT superfamily N-acetyltransferase